MIDEENCKDDDGMIKTCFYFILHKSLDYLIDVTSVSGKLVSFNEIIIKIQISAVLFLSLHDSMNFDDSKNRVPIGQ